MREAVAVKRRLSEAMAIMIGEGLLYKHKFTTMFVQPTKKLLNNGEILTWKYEQAMDLAYLLKERRDILKKKLDHLAYLLYSLKMMAEHNAYKHFEVVEIGGKPSGRLMLPLVAIVVQKSKPPSFRVHIPIV